MSNGKRKDDGYKAARRRLARSVERETQNTHVTLGHALSVLTVPQLKRLLGMVRASNGELP